MTLADPRLSHSHPRRDYPRDRSLPELLGDVAARHADRPAVIDPAGETLNYRELVRRARQLARRLVEAGVQPGDIVPLFVERHVGQVVAELGILFAGAAYLPLDSSYPADRLEFMLEDSRSRCVVVDRSVTRSFSGRTLFRLPESFEAEHADTAASLAHVDPTAAAYVMYTSGSTGRPKGVVVPHRAIARLVFAQDYARFDETRRVLQLAPVSFDASTFEIWAPLLHGGCTVLYPGGSVPDPHTLERTIREHGVTTLWLTASLFNAIVDEMPSALSGIEELLTGGEALSVPHVRRGLERLPNTQLINGYGPTESTTFTTCYRIPRDLPADVSQIPIGPAISNTELLVVDETGRVVAAGEEGELLIGGDGLALGYLYREELTTERFVPHPLDASGGARVYRTGDRVRMRPDGVVEFFGRRDDQIKLNGFRIELGEIETVLRAHPALRDAVIALREDVPGRRRLVAYVVSAEGRQVSVDELLAHCHEKLADYMVPEAVVVLEKIPVTANGKADRRALPAPPPDAAGADDLDFVAPSGPLEEPIARVWSELLRRERVSVERNFFDLGGSSLLAVRALARLRQDLSLNVSLVDLYAQPTVRALARLLTQRSKGTSDSARKARPRRKERGSGKGPIAVIGMALRFPGAESPEQYWENLVGGRDTVSRFDRRELAGNVPAELLDHPDYVAARPIVDRVEWFDPGFFSMTQREAEAMDPQQRLFLELTHEALERAGYDPQRYAGSIGVYGGSGNTTYWQYLLSRCADVVEATGDFLVRLVNEKDFLTTRVSYRLGLRGPALSINTACSTSLVTVAEAVAALRRGDCDIAVAGGSNVYVPVKSDHLYQEGSMLSRDGRCRPFDADATGTLFGDGAGVVVLKPLEQALSDRDTIHAVILGVGLNNDGAAKVSFSAPSVEGQREAIIKAIDDAGVDPRQISYVEAHGTATPVGDPIEIAALTQAYRQYTDDAGFCALGSVKGNLGHLVSAAGAAGLIKVALSLREGTLPPSLHFERANPALELETSPFKVQSRAAPWPAGPNGRRLAGVSSFGVGGTNAHAILEEAPKATSVSSSREQQLIVLSARSTDALARYAEGLAMRLEREPVPALADVAFTLALGRRVCAERLAIVADTPRAAAEALRRAKPRRSESREPRVVFVFPGQGSQTHRMGLGLHNREVAFTEAFDACRRVLEPHLGADLLSLLDPPGGADAAERALRQTELAQPALFAIEYALAKQFLAWGVAPAAFIGHSVGEFVAACLAGVLSLEDALRIVAVRGKLMQAQPAGSMLSVRLAADAVRQRLPAELDFAAVNAPALCVVAGPDAAIDAFAERLQNEQIACKKLHTSHAFHSRSMAPAAEAIEREIRAVRLAPPQIPIYSTVSGRELSAADATDPAYWARQLRSPVEFAAAVAAANAAKLELFLDLGPRDIAAQLVRQQVAPDRAVVTLGNETGKNEQRALLAALGELWKRGVSVDFEAFFAYERRSRVELPTYPFERVRCWIEATSAGPRVTTAAPAYEEGAVVSPAPASVRATSAASKGANGGSSVNGSAANGNVVNGSALNGNVVNGAHALNGAASAQDAAQSAAAPVNAGVVATGGDTELERVLAEQVELMALQLEILARSGVE